MNKKLYLLTVIIMLFVMSIGSHTNAGASPLAAAKSAKVVVNGVSTTCTTFKACDDLLGPDATLYISGEWNEQLRITESGSAGHPINVIGTDALIKVDRTEVSGIALTGSYINLSGFEVIGGDSFGIFITGQVIKVENNIVHDSVLENGTAGNCRQGSWGSAIKVREAMYVEVRGNQVYNSCGEGIALRGTYVLAEYNTVWDNFSVQLYVDNSPYTTAQHNTVKCTPGFPTPRQPVGIAIGEERFSGWGNQRHDNKVLNNYVEGCQDGIVSWEGEMSTAKLIDSVISGNTVVNGAGRAIGLWSKNQNVLIENNTIYAEPFIKYPEGVTVINNTVIGSTPSIFSDVPSTYWAVSYIESLYNAGITGGCSTSPLLYCPSSSVTRAQMAVFLLRGTHGSGYTPPAASGAVFGDVSTNTFAAAWIEQLAAEGITSGCGSGNYCPDATVTRAQMAIFLLRSKYGSAYVPPVATGVFPDVPVGSFAADWIEQLAAEGITSGCGGGNYCPNSAVTRDQMAVFLVKTFNLP